MTNNYIQLLYRWEAFSYAGDGGSENSEASEASEVRLSGEGSEASATQKISVKLPAEPKTICLKVSIQNQRSLDQILRGAGLRSLQRGKTRVFKFDQLGNGAEYTAGSRDDPINTRYGGKKARGIRKKRAVKGIVTRPSQQRSGGLKRRAEQQKAANHQDRATDVKVSYDNTKYVQGCSNRMDYPALMG